jgi:hypothetical protein
LVEHWSEKPGVPGSIPGLGTSRTRHKRRRVLDFLEFMRDGFGRHPQCRGVGTAYRYTTNTMAQTQILTCSICGSERIRLRNGAFRCPSCSKRRNREYYRNSALRRHKARQSYYLRRYGVTLEDVERILSDQGGSCAICRKFWKCCKPAKRALDENLFLHHLCIDHDHERKTVRGLLCNACNTGLGLFEEELDRFEAAMAYLRSSRNVT